MLGASSLLWLSAKGILNELLEASLTVNRSFCLGVENHYLRRCSAIRAR